MDYNFHPQMEPIVRYVGKFCQFVTNIAYMGKGNLGWTAVGMSMGILLVAYQCERAQLTVVSAVSKQVVRTV